MSTRIEWDTAATVDVEVHERGEEFPGYDEPVTHDLGLLIGGATGGAFMVEGTREELLAFLDRAREAIEDATHVEPGPSDTMTGDAKVTMADLHALSELSDACIHGRKVARLIDGDNVIRGVARSIGDEQGNFLRRDEDMRNGYLRVSGIFEYFWPIRELMPQVHDYTFVVERGA